MAEPASPLAADREAALLAKVALDPPYVLLTFRHPEVARNARAGQFVMIKAGHSAEPPLRRPFSIMACDAQAGTFTLFVKAIGPGSRSLAELGLGQSALCLGPLGRPFPAPAEDCEPLLVAGGYGIAPFLLMSAELRRLGRTPRLFYGGRRTVDLQLRDRVEALGVPLVAATEDGSLGHRGRVTEPLEAHLEKAPRAEIFACGPDAMLHAVARIAERRGLPASVSLDPWMGCGFGTCLGCVVRVQGRDDEAPRLRCACTEGPVFDAASVVWPGADESAARRGPAR